MKIQKSRTEATPTLADAARALDVDEGAYIIAASEIAEDRLQWVTPTGATPITPEIAAEIAEAFDRDGVNLDALLRAAELVDLAQASLVEARAERDRAIRAARKAGATVVQIMEVGRVARQTVYDAL